MRKGLVWAVLAAGVWLVPSAAQAALVITFGQSDYLVAPGGTVDVNVFLTQTGSTTILTTEGLASYGIHLTFSGPSTLSQIISNPGFDLENVNTVGAGFGDAEYGIFVNPPVPAVGNSVRLATFRFLAVTGVTTLNVAELNVGPGASNFTSGTGTNLDGLLVASSPATITARTGPAVVPEPAGIVLASLGLTGLGLARLRGFGRRRAA